MINIHEEGLYYVHVTQGNCVFYDSINLMLQTPPQLDLGSDTTSCTGNPLTFTTSISGGTFLWSTEETTSSITVETSQRIHLTATQGQCVVMDTVQVNFLKIPTVDLGEDSVLCLGQEIIWELDETDVTTIWQDGTTETRYQATSDGLYYATQSNNCGSASDSTYLVFFDIQNLTLPNIITPNGDGKNETIRIDHIESCTWVMAIYNRWGGLIYEKTDYQGTWPETTIGDGMYFYELTNLENDQHLKGWIQVLR